MRLITGMQYQGKLAFALGLAGAVEGDEADGGICALSELGVKPVVNQFHLLVRRLAEEQLSVTEQIDQMLYENPEVIIVIDTVAFTPRETEWERDWRRKTGAAGIYLAERAEEVYMVQCGVGVRIK